MTMQLSPSTVARRLGKSKRALQDALNNTDSNSMVEVIFIDPTPFGNRTYTQYQLPVGFNEPVVLDPATRRRFATVQRTAAGWKVS